jgi:hypothetical protein
MCWLCGFSITQLHEPFAVRTTFTNLFKDPTLPTTPWYGAAAHGECVAEHMPKWSHFDPEELAGDIFVEDADLHDDEQTNDR